MQSKRFITGFFLSLSVILSGITLLGNTDLSEVPPQNLPLSSIIQKIPADTKGISSIAYENGRWKIKTVVPASDNGVQAGKEKTGRFLTETCIFNPMTNESEPMGAPEYQNNLTIPPDFNSLKNAAVAVLKAIPDVNITSIEYNKKNWEIRVITNRTQAGTEHPFEDNSITDSTMASSNQTKQFMRYIVDPTTFKIKSTHIDD